MNIGPYQFTFRRRRSSCTRCSKDGRHDADGTTINACEAVTKLRAVRRHRLAGSVQDIEESVADRSFLSRYQL
jgi:hypothetical protein